MGAVIAEQITPSNIAFVTAFFAANPILTVFLTLVLFTFLLAVLSRYFKFGERNATIDSAMDGHIRRLETMIASSDKRIADLETRLTAEIRRASELTGTIQFLTQSQERTARDYDRLKIENNQLQAVNTEQRGEIHTLTLQLAESNKKISRLNEKVSKLELEGMERKAGRRRGDPLESLQGPQGQQA